MRSDTPEEAERSNLGCLALGVVSIIGGLMFGSKVGEFVLIAGAIVLFVATFKK